MFTRLVEKYDLDAVDLLCSGADWVYRDQLGFKDSCLRLLTPFRKVSHEVQSLQVVHGTEFRRTRTPTMPLIRAALAIRYMQAYKVCAIPDDILYLTTTVVSDAYLFRAINNMVSRMRLNMSSDPDLCLQPFLSETFGTETVESEAGLPDLTCGKRIVVTK